VRAWTRDSPSLNSSSQTRVGLPLFFGLEPRPEVTTWMECQRVPCPYHFLALSVYPWTQPLSKAALFFMIAPRSCRMFLLTVGLPRFHPKIQHDPSYKVARRALLLYRSKWVLFGRLLAFRLFWLRSKMFGLLKASMVNGLMRGLLCLNSQSQRIFPRLPL
jgi:hypothetical protein